MDNYQLIDYNELVQINMELNQALDEQAKLCAELKQECAELKQQREMRTMPYTLQCTVCSQRFAACFSKPDDPFWTLPMRCRFKPCPYQSDLLQK